MIEDIKLDGFPKSSGVYLFKTDDEVIYVGSSKNLYKRMVNHRSNIRKGSADGHKQDLYQFLQSNTFTVELQLSDSYKQLEQKLIEKYHPKYNSQRAYTGVGAYKGRVAEYDREYKEKYKEEISEQSKQYYESNKEEISEQRKQYYESHKEKILEQARQYRDSHKEEIKQYKKQYYSQLCLYNGEYLTLNALKTRFKRMGIDHPVIEAKKYLIKKESETPIEFFDVYP